MYKSSLVLPKVYPDAAKSKGPSYYDYENYTILKWNPVDNYVCQRKVGRGKYSEVFESLYLKNSLPCVIKVLKPIKSKKINRQIKILQTLGGQNNCIKLYDIVKDDDICCLVFEHVNNVDFRSFVSTLTPEDCQYYLYQVLIGLNYCHSLGIMHRDIKPQNVMIDHSQKKLRIIDWGLGQYYLPNQNYNVRVSSRYYKGPQLLVGNQYYHYSLDIWSLGVMMGEMIFKKDHLFKGNDNYDQLYQITRILGSDPLFDYVQAYDVELESAYDSILVQQSGRQWKSLVNEDNKNLSTPDAIDLLSKMLQYDHNNRPTAQECMQHPYFFKVRQMYK